MKAKRKAAHPTLAGLCQGCGCRGRVAGTKKPRWCQCIGAWGPIIAPPGYIAMFTFPTRTA